MRCRRHLIPAVVLTVAVLAAGCFNTSSAPLSLNEAHQKFKNVLKEEYDLDVILSPLQDTLWIYLPTDKELFKLAAKQNGAQASSQAVHAPEILFLDGNFGQGRLEVQYDIAEQKKYAKDPGYASSYTEEFQRAQRALLSALPRVYAAVEQVPGQREFMNGERAQRRKRFIESYLKTDKAPTFIVIVIADIVNGIESKLMAHMRDLRQGTTDQFFMEEYTKRLVYADPRGGMEIIGDRTGEHLDMHEVTLPEFLIEQILYRIKFKYQRSDFPPSEDTEEEILKIVNDTVRAYGFEDYTQIKLTNLHTDKSYLYDK